MTTGYRHGMYARALATISRGKTARSPGGRGRGRYVIVYYNEAPTRVRVRPAETGLIHIDVIRQ